MLKTINRFIKLDITILGLEIIHLDINTVTGFNLTLLELNIGKILIIPFWLSIDEGRIQFLCLFNKYIIAEGKRQ